MAAHFTRFSALAEAALEAVNHDPAMLFRVRTAVIPIWHAGIILGRGSKEERMDRIRRFTAHARKLGPERAEEWKNTPYQFITRAIAALESQ